MSSIATRNGDEGTTQIMFGRRLAKTNPQIALLGSIDELSAMLTLARTQSPVSEVGLIAQIYAMQQDLVALMGELSTLPEDWAQYTLAGYASMTLARLTQLDQWITEEEASGIVFKEWNLHGYTICGATMEVARTICRRAEREYWQLGQPFTSEKPLLGKYLNRLADVLWLLARKEQK